MTNIFLLIALVLTVSAGLLVILHRAKVISLKYSHKIISYFVLVIGIIYVALSLFGGSLLEKISVYREGVLIESEEECKSENAPFWCNL
ncbi:MAG: hypothetical protein KJO81_10130 [Gammaproteobacteria bacterium]|nr:hypothetical protein [Gammaproteobacteria bacterium]